MRSHPCAAAFLPVGGVDAPSAQQPSEAPVHSQSKLVAEAEVAASHLPGLSLSPGPCPAETPDAVTCCVWTVPNDSHQLHMALEHLEGGKC